MNYSDYIDLGFERHDFNDNVVFKETGYSGYYLEKEINNRMSILAVFGKLDKPRLYIQKGNSDNQHIIQLTSDMVRDMFAV